MRSTQPRRPESCGGELREPRNTPPRRWPSAPLRILEAVRILATSENTVYQASTSELYGLVQRTTQKETITPSIPVSP